MPQAEATRLFEAHRPRLVRLAYRMLGSLSEAEDVVQDAWLRWQRVELAGVDAPGSYLSRIVTRLCLDVMKSARARRETYVGPWLPEPLVEGLSMTDEAPDADDLTLTLMMALERLSPLERAAFLLHDVFGVPLDDVATTLERAPASVRQLAVRARQHVRDARPRYPVAEDEGSRLAQAFFAASRSGDVAALGELLAQDVVLRSDGGGRVLAFRNPILGLQKVARLFGRLATKHPHQDDGLLRFATIDGLPGFISRERGGVVQTTALAITEGRISEIYITRNPDKLDRLVAALALEAPVAGHG
ncbi:DNA-directed RNA polymerase sigma-70 factor [Azorhizobium oxalatiphilum]|uniref:DNA-directed RNA polymerase sigma-70 factor n=1 Tax=Azorhizobium oxalatiphilum TaxID=980631 RepID=A0A917CFL1_9HYPH|nr:sigma-70 family RNA polymerase sigma factor [Azorhizobium oxalatiphilum]GGF87556.1 DNA-directed RNA polymerase sigma-70 factor [Azorhizobium oxalatiphilum]